MFTSIIWPSFMKQRDPELNNRLLLINVALYDD